MGNNKISLGKFYRLGIDLGTSSIGTAIYELDENRNITRLIHLDSYIFGEPVAPKEMLTLNTARRNARLIRRQVERKAARLRKIGYIAQSLGIERSDLISDKEDVVCLRSKAVEEKITLPQLIKVFCHIVKNRGYKGTLSQADQGVVGKKLSQTSAQLTEGKTLGQLLYERKNKSDGTPWRKIEEDGTFIYREMVEEEFSRIYDKQSAYYPELSANYKVWGENMFPDFPGQKEIPLKDAFHSALFYQRPIKWELETVGSCTLFPQEKRASCAQIAYQQYRLAKDISNLRLAKKGEKEAHPLTLAQQTQLFNYVNLSSQDYTKENKVVPFAKIYEYLALPADSSFTIDRKTGTKQGLKGNTTLFAFEQAGVLNDWAELTDKEQELVIEFLSNVTSFTDINDNTDYYISQSFARLTKNIEALAEERQKGILFILNLKQKGIFKSFELERGRSSYGVKALNLIADGLLQGKEETQILAEIKPEQTGLRGKLRSVAAIKTQESINDPVMSRSLSEFYRILNYIVKKYGRPDEIIVELSREIKNSLRRRQWLEGQNRLQAEERKKAIAELQKGKVLLSPRNIEKYLLWEEQNHLCPYSGQNISFAQAFDEKQTQVDHIIPQQGDIPGPNVFENKVLAFTQENKEKSNRLPYEWKFKEDIEEYLAFNKEKKAKRKKGEDISASFGKHSPLINFVTHLWGLYNKEKGGYYSARERKRKPTQKGARILRKINNLLATPAQVKQDFSNRQNQETAWIGKIVLDWCKDICPKVTPCFGPLTAYMRSQLHFDRILPLIRIEEKKTLFDKDDKEINPKKWKELYSPIPLRYNQAEALKEDFENFCSAMAYPPLTEKDKQKYFNAFCLEQRTQLKFNKRCDHRHHAVDAAVIGLCTLSLVQKAAEHNRKYGTLHTIEWINTDGTRDKTKDVPGFMPDNIPQYDAICKDIKQRLSNYVVWHKPDHFPAGKFFDETAYAIREKDGAERFVKRAPLSSFIKADAQKTKANLEKLLFSDKIKQIILEKFQQRLTQGLSIEEALCGRKDDPKDGIYYRGNKVKQVKYMYLIGRGIREFDPNADKKVTHTDKGGKIHRKAYQNYGYACMDFDAKTGKRTALIPIWKYNNNEEIPQGITRIFIGDTLFDTVSKQFYRVKQFSAQAGLVLRLTTEVNESDIRTNNIKNYKLISSREDIIKYKNE